jgi:hypothetical protein
MSEAKKIFGGLTLRCLGALGVGLAIVIGITTGLLFISGEGDGGSQARVAAYTLKFPEDEQMLKEISAQIMRESNLSASAKSAAQTEPAAGDKSSDAVQH